jgi:hypothetical protein
LASGLVYWRRKLQHVICYVVMLKSSEKDFFHGLIRSYAFSTLLNSSFSSPSGSIFVKS